MFSYEPLCSCGEVVRCAPLCHPLLLLTLPSARDQLEDLVLGQLEGVTVGPVGLVVAAGFGHITTFINIVALAEIINFIKRKNSQRLTDFNHSCLYVAVWVLWGEWH